MSTWKDEEKRITLQALQTQRQKMLSEAFEKEFHDYLQRLEPEQQKKVSAYIKSMLQKIKDKEQQNNLLQFSDALEAKGNAQGSSTDIA